MRFYRVENKNGAGPFRSGELATIRRSLAWDLPTPYCDRKFSRTAEKRFPYWEDGFLFAFRCRADLAKWFPPTDICYPELCDRGYGVAVYLTRCDYIIGDTQVAFNRCRATRLSFEPFKVPHANA